MRCERHVSAGVDGDNEGCGFGTPASERTQLLARLGRSRDQHNGAVTDARERGDVNASEHRGSVLGKVVLYRAFESRKKRRGVGHLNVQVIAGDGFAGGDHRAIQEHLSPDERDLLPLAQGHDVLAEIIHEGDSRVKDDHRPHRSRAPGQRWLGIQDRTRTRRDQRLSAVTVQVRDVNDRYVGLFEARGQVLGSVVDADAPRPRSRIL